MHAIKFNRSEEYRTPPREDPNRLKDDPKRRRGNHQNRPNDLLPTQRPLDLPPILIEARVPQPPLERNKALQLLGHILRSLSLPVSRSHIRPSFHQPLNARRIPLDRGPMEGRQTLRVRAEDARPCAEEEVDGDGVALVARPVEGGVPFGVGGVDGEGVEGEEHVGEEEGRGGVHG